MTEKELLKESTAKLETRAQAGKDGRRIVSALKKQVGIKSDSAHRLKNYWFRRGEGWGSDSVTLAPKAKNPDPLTVLFAKLIQVVEDHKSAVLLSDLNGYLKDLAAHGIEITIYSDSKAYSPDVHNKVVDLAAYQQVMKECDDEIKELGEEAEKIQLAPKGKFSSIASLAYKKLKGKDIDDQCMAAIEEAELTEKAYSTVQSIDLK